MYAALLKRQGGERYMKRRYKPSGNYTRDDRKGTIEEASKTSWMMSEPNLSARFGINSEETCLLSEWHPVLR